MKRALSVTVAAAVLLGTAGPASAAKKPWLGIYDCYVTQASPYFFGGTYLQYQHSVRLRTKGRYQTAFNHKGAQMVDPKKGKWAFKPAAKAGGKNKSLFKTGPFSDRYGSWYAPDDGHPKGFFNEVKKDNSAKGASCYPTQYK